MGSPRFWPPAPTPNGKYQITDDLYAAITGNPARFSAYEIDSTTYWPWFAFEGDPDWPVNDPMLRCQLIGDPDEVLYTKQEDMIGVCLHVDEGQGRQVWEAVAAIDWYANAEASKKFAFLWARLVKIPEEEELPAGGASSGTATAISSGVIYTGTIAPGVDAWWKVTGTSGAVNGSVTTWSGGNTPSGFFVDGNGITNLQTITGPGDYPFTPTTTPPFIHLTNGPGPSSLNVRIACY